MNTNIFFFIREESTPSVKAHAMSKDFAQIYITAPSIQEAMGLIQQGEEVGRQACQIWEPEAPAVEETKKHYKLCQLSVEDLQQRIKDFQRDEQGGKFVRSLEKAENFTSKKDTGGGLPVTQLNYLCNLTYMDVWDGLQAMYSLAYRRGYNKAKAEARK